MKYRLATLLVLGVLALSVWSQNPAAHAATEKQIVYAMPYDFTEFSIFTQQSYATAQWMSTIFAGAYERDSDLDRAYAPMLADGNPQVQVLNKTETGYAMRITVKLKQGLKFSDGTPLTADDVKYTYQLHMTPAIGSGSYSILKAYFGTNDSIVVVDDHTIQFNMKYKYAFFYGFVSSGVLPKHIYQPAVEQQKKYDFEDDPLKYVVSAGPYKLQSIDITNNVVTVVKNPYWSTVGLGNGKLDVDKIIFKKIGTKDAAIQELAKGSVDLVDSQYKPLKNDFKNLQHVVEQYVTTFSHQEMSINNIHPVWGHTAQLDLFLNKTYVYHDGNKYTIRSFWDEISNHKMNESQRVEAARLVREAISYIVPRQDIVDNILEGFGEPAPTIMPKPAIGWDPTLKPREYSVEKAMDDIIQAFKLAGWNNITADPNDKNGIYVGNLMDHFDDWSIILLSPNTNPARNQWALLMQNEFPKIGIHVKFHVSSGWDVIVPRTFGYNLDVNDYLQPDGTHTPVPLFEEGGFDLLFVGYAWGLDWDPQGLYETWAFLPFGINFYNWWDPKYDELSDSYVSDLDANSRIQKAHEIQAYLYKWEPAIPLVYSQDHWGWREGLTGLDLVLLSSSAQQWWKVKFNPVAAGTTGGGFLPFSSFFAIATALGALALIPYIRKSKK